MAKALLFDIDGTLIRTGGAGALACKQALAQGFHLDDPNVNVDYGGRTDLSLIREFFLLNNIKMHDDSVATFFDYYHRALPASLSSRSGEILAGVRSLLDLLHKQPDVYLGLVTGNSEQGAQSKLQHFDLWKDFKFGGFGHEAEERNDIAHLGRARAQELAGRLGPHDVIVIGDTPKDIHCARSIGARVIAVLTGFATEASIIEAKPDLILEDLTAAASFIAFING